MVGVGTAQLPGVMSMEGVEVEAEPAPCKCSEPLILLPLTPSPLARAVRAERLSRLTLQMETSEPQEGPRHLERLCLPTVVVLAMAGLLAVAETEVVAEAVRVMRGAHQREATPEFPRKIQG